MTDNELITALTDLKIQVSAYRAEATAQNTVTNAKLISIESHLAKQNGRVGKLEERVTPLENHCKNTEELPTKIRKLEDSQLTQDSIKRWVVGAIGITATVVSIIFTVLNYFMKSGA